MITPVDQCQHLKVSYRSTDGAHHCDECNAKFFHLDPQPGKITYMPMPETATLRDQFAMGKHSMVGRRPKGRLKETLAKLKALQSAPWVKAGKMPPLEASILEVTLLGELPMEVRMLPEMRYRGYDNIHMGR
jgi:hypothetical protein